MKDDLFSKKERSKSMPRKSMGIITPPPISLILIFALIAFAPSNAYGTNIKEKDLWVLLARKKIESGGNWNYIRAIEYATDKRKNGQEIDALSLHILKTTPYQRITNGGVDEYSDLAWWNKMYRAAVGQVPVTGLVLDNFQKDLVAIAEDRNLGKVLRSIPESAGSIFRARERAVESLTNAYDLASKDETLRNAINSVLGPEINARIGEGLESLISKNTEAKSIYDKLESYATTRGNRQALEKLIKEIEESKKNVGDLADIINKKLEAAVSDSAKAVEAVRNAEREEIQLRKAAQLKREELDSVIDFALANSKHGDLVNTSAFVAASLLRFQDTLSKYSDSLNLIGDDDYGRMALAGASFATSSVTIGMAIVSYFGNNRQESSSQAAHKQLIDHLQFISNQINEYQKENRARFDRIDASLNTINSQIYTGFSAVLESLNNASESIQDTRSLVAFSKDTMAASLDRIESKIDNLSRQDFLTATSSCLSYTRTYGGKMSEEQYKSCTAQFRTFLKQAGLPVFSGLIPDDKKTNPLLDGYRTYTFESDINLARALIQGEKAFTPAPNLEMWASVVLAYSQLAAENPDYFRRSPRTFLNEIKSSGELLVEARRLFATNDEFRLAAKKALDQLILRYSNAIREVEQEARAVRRATLKSWKSSLADISGCVECNVTNSIPMWVETASKTAFNPETVPYKSPPSVNASVPANSYRSDPGYMQLRPGSRFWWEASREPIIPAYELFGIGTYHTQYYAEIRDPVTHSYQTEFYVEGRPAIDIYLFDQINGFFPFVMSHESTASIRFFSNIAQGQYQVALGFTKAHDLYAWLNSFDLLSGRPIHTVGSHSSRDPDHCVFIGKGLCESGKTVERRSNFRNQVRTRGADIFYSAVGALEDATRDNNSALYRSLLKLDSSVSALKVLTRILVADNHTHKLSTFTGSPVAAHRRRGFSFEENFPFLDANRIRSLLHQGLPRQEVIASDNYGGMGLFFGSEDVLINNLDDYVSAPEKRLFRNIYSRGGFNIEGEFELLFDMIRTLEIVHENMPPSPMN